MQGRHLIEASAGTGKTFNIATLFVRAVIERNIPVKNILVVTYTEAATKELKDRLLSRIGDCMKALQTGDYSGDSFLELFLEHVEDKEEAYQKLETALHSFDEASVYTIHAFCYQALQEQAFQSKASFDTEMVGDDTEIIQEAVDDYWRRWVNEASADSRQRPLLQYLRQQGYTPDKLAGELASIVGKPYMEILPEDEFQTGPLLKKLWEQFKKMQKHWESSREEIKQMLLSDPISGSKYRESWLKKWMSQMGDLLSHEIPPIQLFDKFIKFTSSEVAGSLTKSAEDKGLKAPEHPFFDLSESYLTIAEQLKPYTAYFKKKLLEYLYDELEKRKQRQQVLSYDDLLNHLSNSLSDPTTGEKLAGMLRNKYPVALVDEFQDTDPIQYEIFSKIYSSSSDENSGLFMIGDPKQSIYSFRGADVFSYLKAKNEVKKDNRHSLHYNYRSTPSFIKGVNALFGNHENPFLLDDIPFQQVKPGRPEENYDHFIREGKVQPPLEFRSLAHWADELPVNKGTAGEWVAEDTAEEIAGLLNNPESRIGDRRVQGKDIAVLVRKHTQADLISDALLEKGIKSVRYSQESVFKSAEAEELARLLKAIAEPNGERTMMAALSTRILGYNANQLLELQENELKWVELTNYFKTWNLNWQQHGFAYMFRSLMQQMKIAERVVKYRNGERILTNLLHLSELIQQQEKEEGGNIRALLHWFSKKRNNPDKEAEEEQLRLESDENLVKIVTMHRSKGLQYPIVFCPFLWHGPKHQDRGNPVVYHEEEDSGRTVVDFSSEKGKERDNKRFEAAREELAESMRLAYVAITRAQYRCVIPWIPASKTEISSLGYLLLSPKKVLDTLNGIIYSDGNYEPIDPDLYMQRLGELKNEYPDCISVVDNGAEAVSAGSESMSSVELSPRVFTRTAELEKGPAISSFSGLVYTDDSEFSESDLISYYDGFSEIKTDLEEPEGRSIFTFPRGPKPGTCIHHIYENIDFQQPDNLEEVAKQKLLKFGIDKSWKGLVASHIEKTLYKELSNEIPGLILSSILPKDRIAELEFYFKSDAVELNHLLELIDHDSSASSGFAESGFIKGFIDLTFRFNGKYYLLDYKTNHLGNASEDYDLQNMKEEINHHMYDLQYHLYSVALHWFLKNKIQDYSYESHFGGAFYLFIRGMNKEGSEGIFFDKPEKERIEQLDAYLSGGNIV